MSLCPSPCPNKTRTRTRDFLRLRTQIRKRTRTKSALRTRVRTRTRTRTRALIKRRTQASTEGLRSFVQPTTVNGPPSSLRWTVQTKISFATVNSQEKTSDTDSDTRVRPTLMITLDFTSHDPVRLIMKPNTDPVKISQ